MRRIIKVIAIGISLMLAMVSAISCSCDSDKDSLDKYLFNKSQTDYRIVIDSTASGNTLFAAEELRTFLQEATLGKIPVENADSLVHNQNLKVISIGKNDLSESAALNFDVEVQNYEINTVDNCIYIVGGDDNGNLYGVYELLERLIDFQVYAVDEIYYESKTTIKLPDLSVKGGPDISIRLSGFKYIEANPVFAKRLRQNQLRGSEFWLTGSSHNYGEYISKDDGYSEDKWFSYSTTAADNETSLCLTARGDEESLIRMKQRVADVMIDRLKTNSQAILLNFSQPDKNIWCQCDTCKASNERYGTDSAVVIKFMNDVSDIVLEWLRENDPRRADKVYFVFLGYHKTQEPPVVTNTDATYTPISDDIKLHKQVGVYLAPVFSNYNTLVEDKAVGTLIKKWSVVSENIFLWLYQTNFSYHLYPYNSIGYMQENYQFYEEYSTKFVYNSGQYRARRSTAFHEFKGWLDSKLQWDNDCDVAQLTKDYFSNVFKTAYEPMYEFYMTLSNYMMYLENDMGLGGSIYQNIHDSKYWPLGVMNTFMSYINKAYELIDFYKETDPELYGKLEERITRESIFPRYVLLTLYAGTYSTDKLQSLREEFMDDCFRVGIVLVKEWVSMYEGVFKDWGL